MPYSFHTIEPNSARSVLSWRYEPPYDIYNTPPALMEESITLLLDPRHHYHSILDEMGDLVAYCCFGQDGQVPGGDYSQEALDIGLGVRPDLTGQGRGQSFVRAVVDFAHRTYSPPALRVTIAHFNLRALRVWKKAGFRAWQTFSREPDGLAFVVLVCETGRSVL